MVPALRDSLEDLKHRRVISDRGAKTRLTRAGGDDPLLRASGMIAGLPSNRSAQFDRYFAETFVAEKPARHTARPG